MKYFLILHTNSIMSIEQQILLNKDIFCHIFFHLSPNKKYLFCLSIICKGIEITSDSWKYIFRQCGYQLPKIHIKHHKTWLAYIERENTIIDRVNFSMECINYMSTPITETDDSEKGNEIFYGGMEKYFGFYDGSDHCLYFGSHNFDIEQISHLLNDEIREQILVMWSKRYSQREVCMNGKGIRVYQEDILIQFDYDKSFKVGRNFYECLFRFDVLTDEIEESGDQIIDEQRFECIFNEQEARKIIEILLRNGSQPYNCNKNILLI
jgi:hypothetical protein